MGGKDKTQKILESYNDVFSDIVNVLLFGGRSVISEDELEEQAPRAYYKAAGQLREMERDVAKRWKKGNIRVACVGLENQTDADADMPLRVIGYDGAEYRSQLLPDNKGKSRYPVVTLVLYFGYKSAGINRFPLSNVWRFRRSLRNSSTIIKLICLKLRT